MYAVWAQLDYFHGAGLLSQHQLLNAPPFQPLVFNAVCINYQFPRELFLCYSDPSLFLGQ